MTKVFMSTIILSLCLTSAIFAGQDMMKRQEPTMQPVMKPVPMMKKASASPTRVKKNAKKKFRKARRTIRKSV